MLKKYLKNSFLWIITYIFGGLILVAVLFLNDAPMAEILYGTIVYFFVAVCTMVYGFYREKRKSEELQLVKENIGISIDNMPFPGSLVEEEYQKAIEKLYFEKNEIQNDKRRREREMSDYYNMWVHQIKTPIAALKLLLDDETDVALLKQEVFRIEQYVEMALHYARLGSESTDFLIKRVDVDHVIRDSIRKFAPQFIRKKIGLEYEGCTQTVLSDEKWLSFVIDQVVSNAIKYTKAGKISISVCGEAGNVQIKLKDTGIGIRKEDLPRVCEKGYTGYNGRVDKTSTGIGLYLCTEILNKLGHSMSISSEEGQGTCVVLSFKEE